MKKTLALVLMLAAVLLCTTALAAEPTISTGSWEDGGWGPPYDHTQAQPLYTFNLSADATVTAKIYNTKTGEYFATCYANGAAMDNASVNAGVVTLYWHGVDDNGYHEGVDGQRVWVDYELVIEVSNADGSDKVSEDFSFSYVHSIAQHAGYAVWYPNNTVCSFGPEFKTAIPGITNDWYTFSAVDLTVQGTQTFDLVAAGAWKLGTVSVTVNGDEVVVDYLCTEDVNTADVWDEVIASREWFTIFSDLDAVTTVVPEEIDTAFEFGKTISIANDLGGDTEILLYVNNVMTYGHHNPYVTRFWPNLPENKALRESMMQMLAD